jgi:hypothetical protein
LQGQIEVADAFQRWILELGMLALNRCNDGTLIAVDQGVGEQLNRSSRHADEADVLACEPTSSADRVSLSLPGSSDQPQWSPRHEQAR